MCPFGDIMDVPDSSYWKSELCWIFMCYLSPFQNPIALVCNFSLCWATECDRHTTHTRHTQCEYSATQALLSWKLSLCWAIYFLASEAELLDYVLTWQSVRTTQKYIHFGSLPEWHNGIFILAACQNDKIIFSFWQPAKRTEIVF